MTAASTFTGFMRGVACCGRLMVGVPSYEAYLAHIQGRHADTVPMTEAEFFRDRQSARFGEGGRGGFRCC